MSVARRAVVDLALSCGGDPSSVGLATSEAVTNAVLHAYRDREPGEVRVRAKLEGSDLIVTVSDDGCGLRPDLDSPGLGMGIALIGTVTSGMNFDSSGNGLDLSMRFPCPGP